MLHLPFLIRRAGAGVMHSPFEALRRKFLRLGTDKSPGRSLTFSFKLETEVHISTASVYLGGLYLPAGLCGRSTCGYRLHGGSLSHNWVVAHAAVCPTVTVSANSTPSGERCDVYAGSSRPPGVLFSYPGEVQYPANDGAARKQSVTRQPCQACRSQTARGDPCT